MKTLSTYRSKQFLRELSNGLIVAIIASLLVIFPPIVEPADATAISGSGPEANIFGLGTYHAVALNSKGLLYTWGYNASGQLGDGSAQTATYSQLISVP